MTLGKVVCQNIILTEDTLLTFFPAAFMIYIMIFINGWGLLSCHGDDL